MDKKEMELLDLELIYIELHEFMLAYDMINGVRVSSDDCSLQIRSFT